MPVLRCGRLVSYRGASFLLSLRGEANRPLCDDVPFVCLFALCFYLLVRLFVSVNFSGYFDSSGAFFDRRRADGLRIIGITFTYQANTAGWLALGLSPDGALS